MYGLSGASGKSINLVYVHAIENLNLGRHNCLWCLIKREELITPTDTRGLSEQRTLTKIKEDYQRFVAAGAIHEHAKEFNNVMAPHFFDIPISQVQHSHNTKQV